MRLIITIIIIIIFSKVYSQKEVGNELLSPLGSNHVLIGIENGELAKNVDGLFYYEYDTLKLPEGKGLIDDFTTNKFKPINAQPGDLLVTDTTWFHLYRLGVPDTMGSEYMFDTTYYTLIDTILGFGFDSLVYANVAFGSIEVLVYDLCTYPPTSYLDTVWPNSAYIDSVWPTSTIIVPFTDPNPDLEQDSVVVYKVATSILDTGYLWIDKFAYLNNTYAVDPPSYGVVTFDGLDEVGYPYNFISTSAGQGDYLTSVPIDLAFRTDGTPWGVSDSLELSFWYQPQGLGNEPELNDSLVLQFWSPSDEEWASVWFAQGSPLDTFKRASIKIRTVNYLMSGFQFRFMNYGALNGSLDHWHIDFVQLKSNAINDETLQEVAIQYPVNTMLKEYTAMPWKHFKESPESNMLDSVNLRVANSWTLSVAANTTKYDVSESGTMLTTVFADNATSSVAARGKLSIPIDVYQDAAWFYYDTAVSDTSAFFDVDFNFTGGVFLTKSNETFSLKQTFTNFYAYDDGTAEAAYGITGTQPKLAYRFTTPLSDSLFAVKIHFEPSVNDVSLDPFILMVWDNAGPGGTPGNVIYEEPLLTTPKYNLGVNGYYVYQLSEKVLLNGTFYVGWKQTTSSRLNVGFDKNIDNQDKIYYNVSGTWANTSYQGSLMLRPMFDGAQPTGWVSNDDYKLFATAYPNPALSYLHITMAETGSFEYQLIDLNGRVLVQNKFVNRAQISVDSYAAGIYMLKVSDKMGNFTILKVIIE
ncbi:MAG: T9SS type A sorting domain-containing protein [Crocinitomicaceae bacterium]|nr:T9SS type A sorting domain-containing protein [Crocinitomicaceae bacterium]